MVWRESYSGAARIIIVAKENNLGIFVWHTMIENRFEFIPLFPEQ